MNTPHGTYTWQETKVGQNSSSGCKYGAEAGVNASMAMVTRECGGPYQWLDYYGGYCITEITHRIQQLKNVSTRNL